MVDKKVYDTIYINGDSYSSLDGNRFSKPGAHKVYSDFLKNMCPDIKIINAAMSGSNNARIFRKSTEDLLTMSEKTFAVIGFSFTERQELWYTGNNPSRMCSNTNTHDFPINSDLIDKLKFDTSMYYFYEQETNKDFNDPDIKNMITNKHQSPTKNMTDFIFNLVQFAGFLKSNNIDYLLFRAAQEGDMEDLNWDFIKSTNAWKCIQQDSGILDLDFSIPNFAADNNFSVTDTGHMYEDGHFAFAKYLKHYV